MSLSRLHRDFFKNLRCDDIEKIFLRSLQWGTLGLALFALLPKEKLGRKNIKISLREDGMGGLVKT